MLTVTQLPHREERELRQWLLQPQCRVFQQLLLSLCAQKMADAANSLMGAEESAKTDAEDAIAEAKRFRAAQELLATFSEPEHQIRVPEIRVQSLTTEENAT